MLAASGELLIVLGLLRIARKARKEFGADWCEEKGIGRIRKDMASSTGSCTEAVEAHCNACGKCRFGRGQVIALPPRSAQ